MRRIIRTVSLGAFLCISATAAFAQVRQEGPIVDYAVPPQENGAAVDFANARPMPLPAASVPLPSQAEAISHATDPFLLFGNPGVSNGGIGTGETDPVELLPPDRDLKNGRLQTPPPPEFGTAQQPYTTSRVNPKGSKIVTKYPFRAAGKLFFTEGSTSYVCSASLIKPGIVVTAAHCVANYGQQQFYSNWVYVPAYNNGSAAYGKWSAVHVRVLDAYYNGTDNCAQYGVTCPDDVAVITERPKSGIYPGTKTGWLAYGWNGYSYNSSGQVLIDQLGYPVALDNGELMERNDSQGYVSPSLSGNTIIGSLMTGGSSGGPWTVNLGMPPTLSGVSFGTGANHNVVVGVTSWGFTDPTVKQQGASPFTTNNIVALVNAACTLTPKAC